MRTTVELHGGIQLPRLGLGIFRTPSGDATERAVLAALEVGYRHVDTASIYGNEHDVGDAIRRSVVPRSEIFVTTKLWNADQGFDSTLRAFDASLKRLGLSLVDLYLLRWPVPDRRRDSWRAPERLYDEKSIVAPRRRARCPTTID